MKHRQKIYYFFIFVIFFSISASAEFVFKKDGTIIKGTILQDQPGYFVVKSVDKGTISVKREDILRVLYTELYMGKVYVRLTSGEVVEGYQVNEDRDNYTFRKVITSPEEFVLPRKKVMFIARTNPTDLTGNPSIEKIDLRWSPPFKPAKLYRVYLRENKKSEKFKVIGETSDTEYTLKKLGRSASYEVYVTAIGDTGEESLPSEKIIANTIPVSPDDLVMTEKMSDDGKTVTLTMQWKPVRDSVNRVKSYTVYMLDDGERKKLGTVTSTEFVIKDFPAEGKHRFGVVAVNDLGTESEDVRAVYDAGYRIYTRVTGAYLTPLGDFGVIADSGYGGLLGFSVGNKNFSIGFETGYLSFKGADDEIKTIAIAPMLLTTDYRLPLFFSLLLRPVFKFGEAYIMTEYLVHNPLAPLETETVKNNKFNPMFSGGLFLELGVTDHFSFFGGAEYSAIFEKSGRMSFISYSFGASAVF